MFICAHCQQRLDPAAHWLLWPHTAANPPHASTRALHTQCRSAYAETVSASERRLWSVVHGTDLPAELKGVWVTPGYLVAYTINTVLCLQHRHHANPTSSIYPYWRLTIYDYEIGGVDLHQEVVSVRVEEFMEASWVEVKLASGELVRYGQDLYDIALRWFGQNRSGAALRHPTFL